MHDDWLEQELRRALGGRAEKSVPGFASVMQAAEARDARGRLRYRFVAATAVIASATAVTIAQWPGSTETPGYEFLTASTLLESTHWVAPSDVLLPAHRFDIYRDMPLIPGSTETEEGTLL